MEYPIPSGINLRVLALFLFLNFASAAEPPPAPADVSGQAVDGAQLTLSIAHVPGYNYPLGLPVLHAKIRNSGSGTYIISPLDLAQGADFEIDGLWYGVDTIGGSDKKSKLLPGTETETFGQNFDLRRLYRIRDGSLYIKEQASLQPGPHVVCTRVNLGILGGKYITLISNPVTFTYPFTVDPVTTPTQSSDEKAAPIVPATIWGHAVEGAQLSLANAQNSKQQPPPELPVFEAKIRNSGQDTYVIDSIDLANGADVEIDGVWYETTLYGGNSKRSKLLPGTETETFVQNFDLRRLYRIRDGALYIKEQASLQPDPHVVRTRVNLGILGGKYITLVSNPVSFTFPFTPVPTPSSLPADTTPVQK